MVFSCGLKLAGISYERIRVVWTGKWETYDEKNVFFGSRE